MLAIPLPLCYTGLLPFQGQEANLSLEDEGVRRVGEI